MNAEFPAHPVGCMAEPLREEFLRFFETRQGVVKARGSLDPEVALHNQRLQALFHGATGIVAADQADGKYAEKDSDANGGALDQIVPMRDAISRESVLPGRRSGG